MACSGGPAPAKAPAATPEKAPETTIISTEPSFFSSPPAQNGLVFIGAAGKRSNPKETVQAALEDAARRVSVYHEVTGEYAVEHNIGSGFFDYTHNTYTALYYDREGSNRYIDALQYDTDTDTLEMENILFVRTVYPSALPVPVTYRPTYYGPDRRPDWVDAHLEIKGYEVGVGYSGRHSSLADTYTNSCNNAIFAIIRNVNTTSQSTSVYYQNTGSLFGYKTSNDNTLYSYGILAGFYVLDTWIDPKNKTVWTLAIVKKLD
ncbi:MAG: LPP20 family lipoprotein [Treponema sp.]|nr:LPP20 family lipoprotein [Treponema sp.]